MPICERCRKEHTGVFGSGRYCCRACANARAHSKEVYERVSKSLTGRRTRVGGVAPNRKPRITIQSTCIVCAKTFGQEVPDTEAGKRNGRKTCSSQCAYDFKTIQGRNSAAMQAHTRRSRNEIAFANLCESHFGNVETNARMFNGWDADVILKDQKIAVLWNGKWHYEKITFAHSVVQVQNRDKIKIMEIRRAGYVPYVIKDMGREDPVFVEEQFGELVKWLSRGPHKAE